MSAMEEEEVTLEELATICEENQEELADLILKDVPLYSAQTESAAQVETTIHHTQVPNFLECDVIVTTDITDVAQEETCCSSDWYNVEVTKSPESDGSTSNFSPGGRKKCGRTRKVRTPNTLQHMMEKHRHSERKRHHSLNEQLKTICDLIPGANLDNRETKVVMMQRVISYITYLENSVKLLCCQTGGKLRPSWVLLTTNFASYFHDYFKGIGSEDYCDDEILAATESLSRSMQQEDEEPGEGIGGSSSGGDVPSRKMSSPTVDSTTSDCVVPVMTPAMAATGGRGGLAGDQEVMLLSQDSGLAASILGAGGQGELWALCESTIPTTITKDVNMATAAVGASDHGDAEVFFRSSIDDGVSAVLEISSSIPENKPLVLGLGEDYKQQESMVDQTRWASDTHVHSVLSPLTSLHQGGAERKPMGTLYTIQKHVPTMVQRRHKRKQPSPRRSASQDDYLSDKAYLPSWSTVAAFSSAAHNLGKDRSSSKAAQRVLPYNIRCNHRYPVQRLQATGAAARLLVYPFPTPLHITASMPPPKREPLVKAPEKSSNKLDLRKTSWMNGFMMFSRLNRRTFIQAHPGVHTSHISKIMGHAWRNMSKEEQAPYKEKAQLCAKELYKVYTNQPLLSQSSVSTTTAALAAADAAIATITTATATTTTPDSSLIPPLPLSLIPPLPISSPLQE